jgi:hypothetical protein
MCAHPAGGNIVGVITIGELSKQVGRDVFVRSRRRSGLARVLTGHGCNSACRTPSWALGHRYGPLQDCIAGRITYAAGADAE